MGYDLEMVNKKGILKVKEFKAGGNCNRNNCFCTNAEISITYNYAWFFYKFMNKKIGIKAISNKSGKQAKPILKKMLNELSTPESFGSASNEVEYDYWIPTPINVARILKVLISWCEQHPNGVFKIC